MQATTSIIFKLHFRYMLKPLKQKLFVDGLSYLLQEIYGLENKVMLIYMLYRSVLEVLTFD